MEEIARAICDERSFTYVKSVGRGSFKETFLVRDSNGHNRALKVFRADLSPERTERELEAMIKCDHPSIGRLEDVSTFGHSRTVYTYIVEEYLGGGTLADLIQKGPLATDQLVALGKSLIDALDHMASQGLVHRDLKPENIMFSDDGIPVIVDFGLVRDLSRASITNTWLVQGPGTPYYAAPEQLNNNKNLIDWRTDQFGLGTVFAVCGYGNHPYAEIGDKPGTVVARVASRQSPSNAFVQWTISSEFKPILKMVQPWPVQRYRTPDALREAWVALEGR